jgi:hypothetical protein
MKGIILNLEKRFTYVLAEDGGFRKVYRKESHRVGDEISIDVAAIAASGRRKNRLRAISVIAACFVCLIGGTAFADQWDSADYSMYIDINPSVRLDVNGTGHVISESSLNADGAAVLDGSDSESSLVDSVKAIIKEAKDTGYIEQYGVTLTLVGASDEMVAEVREMMQGAVPGVDIHVMALTKEEEQDAYSHGVTPLKYKRALIATETYPELNMDQALSMSSEYLADLISGKATYDPEQFSYVY